MHRSSPSSHLVCHDLSFAWPDGRVVLEGLDLTLPPGRTGLVGANGSGKSTLLRLLAGGLAPTRGHVERPERVALLPQGAVLGRGRTVASLLGVDVVLTALDRLQAGTGTPEDLAADLVTVGDAWEVEARAAAALADLGFAGVEEDPRAWLDRPLATLSGGEVALLRLAALLLARPAVLLLDEPTNDLDARARARLHAALEAWSRPVLVASHDVELLERMDATAELRDGGVRLVGGGFSAYAQAVADEQVAARRDVRDARGVLRRQRRELVDARTTLARRERFGRAAYARKRHPKTKMQQLKRSAQESAGRLRSTHEADVERADAALRAAQARVRPDPSVHVDLPATRVPPGRDVAVLDRVVLRNGPEVSLHLRGPERVGLVGSNGSGKTTLLRTLVGGLAPRAGAVRVGVPVRVLPQRLDLLAEQSVVLEAVGRSAPTRARAELRAALARFGLGADLLVRPVGTLSGGERFRATLAALLLAEPAPQLLVLDEPTNSLDLDSVTALVSALEGYRGALLVASHDRAFLDRLRLDRVLDLDALRDDPRRPVPQERRVI